MQQSHMSFEIVDAQLLMLTPDVNRCSCKILLLFIRAVMILVLRPRIGHGQALVTFGLI